MDTSSVANNPTLSSQLRISCHDDGAVILDIEGGRMFSANNVGARILVLLEQQKGVEEIVQHVSSEFSEPPDRVHSDVLGFIESLRDSRLIRP